MSQIILNGLLSTPDKYGRLRLFMDSFEKNWEYLCKRIPVGDSRVPYKNKEVYITLPAKWPYKLDEFYRHEVQITAKIKRYNFLSRSGTHLILVGCQLI
jgi:hypothetical protein